MLQNLAKEEFYSSYRIKYYIKCFSRVHTFYRINNNKEIREKLISYMADISYKPDIWSSRRLAKEGSSFLIKLRALKRDFYQETTTFEINKRKEHQFDENSLLFHLNRQPFKTVKNLSIIKSISLKTPPCIGQPTSTALYIALRKFMFFPFSGNSSTVSASTPNELALGPKASPEPFERKP